MSNSIIADTGRYSRTRLIRWRILALWLLLLAASLLSGGKLHLPAEQAGFLLAAILVFRLWDDLADLAYDQLHHPDRVLHRTNNLWPFIMAVVAGLVLLALMLENTVTRLLTFLLFVVSMMFLYHTAAGKKITRPLRTGLVLAKYPLFLFLVVAHTSRSWLVGLVLFITLWVYEWRSDRELRNARPRLLVAGAAAGASFLSVLHFSAGAWS